MDEKIRIIFFGEDSFSNIVLNSLIKDNYSVLFVLSPFYNNNHHLRLENTCKKNNIPYFREKNINSISIINHIKESEPDFIIVTHFQRIIVKDIIIIPKYGCLNLHPSLLPFYRGMAPQHWPIINGEQKTGVTVHYIDEGVDTGNIIAQEEISLYKDMYVSDLQLIWTSIYPEIINKSIQLVLNGYMGQQQKKEVGSYYPKLKFVDCKIDVNGSIKSAYNLIRGLSFPYDGAFIETNNEIIRVWRAEIISDKPLFKIGHIMKDEKNSYLSFIDGTIKINKFTIINKYQNEGENN